MPRGKVFSHQDLIRVIRQDLPIIISKAIAEHAVPIKPLDVTGVCELLSISPKVLNQWIKERQFPAHKIDGTDKSFFYLPEINEWVQNNGAPYSVESAIKAMNNNQFNS